MQAEQSPLTWPPEVEKTMMEMVLFAPAMYKKNARLIVQSATEKIARANNRQTVTEEDLAIALLKITPPPFQGMLFKRSQEIGFDIKKYQA